ncbi:hypothetical protein PLANPX_4211 [Lacipirellula parvula]|uniref:Uncharacterized protein n=1 Tax=Lacipirellula parvula TaxID=2650471 RepID=A0A5K7XN99_9BACT|nr:hypothetical protein PLANPX_4211 [Lacipirellula parvula]
MPGELVTRYCPSCEARVKALEQAFSQPRKCPKCQTVVTFFDYPRDVRDAVPIRRRLLRRSGLITLFTLLSR